MRTPDRAAAGSWLVLLLMPPLLAGCAVKSASTLPGTVPVPAAVVAVPELPPPLDLAGFAMKARTMAGADLQTETQRLLDRGDGPARLQAAIALAQAQHPARDEELALQLAREVARAESGSAQLRDAAALVALWIDEQRRADVVARRAQGRARDDELRIQALEQRLRDTERRALEAEKKLEALRAIERDLSGRGAANGRPERQ